MPHTTPKTSRIPGPLHKAGLFVLFAAITAALCLLLNFLLVDDLHAYSRVTLGEYYAQADAVDTVFVGSSHSYRSFDPDTIDPILGSHSFNLGTSQQQPNLFHAGSRLLCPYRLLQRSVLFCSPSCQRQYARAVL